MCLLVQKHLEDDDVASEAQMVWQFSEAAPPRRPPGGGPE